MDRTGHRPLIHLALRGLCGLCVLCGFLPTTPGAAPVPAPAGDANNCLYLPPDFEKSVLFYHSFGLAAEKPEINRLGAKLGKPAGQLVEALTGKGFTPAKGGRALSLGALALPLTRPITVGLWFRLDEPMKAESGFHLISLHTPAGYVSNFVRGKGQWCALKQPTFVMQLYRFPGISNVNGIRFGDAWLAEKAWHHAAVTISEGSRVRVYWDGRLRSDVTPRGRMFGAKDVVRNIGLGPHWLGHPMTVDELLVLDRALTAGEVGSYTTAVLKLAEQRFGVRGAGARSKGATPARPD